MLNTLYIALGMPPSKKSHKLGLFAKLLLTPSHIEAASKNEAQQIEVASEIEAPSQIESASQIYFTLQNEAL